ncbi:uncharacterized protein LOC141629373 [Silene latifolia]|uniref:uncharacterized protein LOC141629373 n=1 Tax=Silene latifolia TaxID=37657 RepID=UPI003D76A725
MSVVWTTLKRSLHCKSTTSEVYDPNPVRTRKNCCKTSCKSAKKDVVHGKRRLKGNPRNCSPVSVRSSDLINPVTHNIKFTNSGIRIIRSHSVGGSPYLGSFGSPSPRLSKLGSGSRSDPILDSGFSRPVVDGGDGSSAGSGVGDCRVDFCNKCGESLVRQDGEVHLLSKHAVTEVHEGDSTRKIIEMIFLTGWSRPMNQISIQRILKVHNPETKLAYFEEYREMVKIRAHRANHSKKHPRCLADGNELLRFYGTTLACSLGKNKTSNLCNLQTCNVCCILRHGFSAFKELDQSVLGIFTTSTSETAYKSIETDGVEGMSSPQTGFQKALILCRVIAGRVHKPILDSSSELTGGRRSGFDSFAGKMGSNSSHIEELYVLKAAALLPCFVIVCQP